MRLAAGVEAKLGHMPQVRHAGWRTALLWLQPGMLPRNCSQDSSPAPAPTPALRLHPPQHHPVCLRPPQPRRTTPRPSTSRWSSSWRRTPSSCEHKQFAALPMLLGPRAHVKLGALPMRLAALPVKLGLISVANLLNSKVRVQLNFQLVTLTWPEWRRVGCRTPAAMAGRQVRAEWQGGKFGQQQLTIEPVAWRAAQSEWRCECPLDGRSGCLLGETLASPSAATSSVSLLLPLG